MCPFSEQRDYLLLIFELWIIDAHIRTYGVHGTRLFFSHCYTSTDGSEERDSRAYIVKEFVHVRGRVAYAWTAWNSNWAQERTFVRYGTTFGNPAQSLKAMRDVWKWISRRREKRMCISLRNALVSNRYNVKGRKERIK